MIVTPGLATTSAKRAASTRSGALGAATGAAGPCTATEAVAVPASAGGAAGEAEADGGEGGDGQGEGSSFAYPLGYTSPGVDGHPGAVRGAGWLGQGVRSSRRAMAASRSLYARSSASSSRSA